MSLRRAGSNDPFVYADYDGRLYKLHLKESELEFLQFKREKISPFDAPDPRLGDYEA